MTHEPITPGQRVYWQYSHGRYEHIARVVSIAKRTASIEVRRSDGRVKRRFVKLTRLYGVRR